MAADLGGSEGGEGSVGEVGTDEAAPAEAGEGVVSDHAAAQQALRACLEQPIAAELLQEVVRDSWRALIDDSTLMVEAEAELGAERVRGHHQPLIADLAAWFREGQAAGTLRSDRDPIWSARTYDALVRVAVSLAEKGSGVDDPAFALQDTVRVLLGVGR